MNKQAPLYQNFDSGRGSMQEVVTQEIDDQSANIATTLRSMWSAIYRDRLLICAIVAAAALLGLITTMLMTPKYSATASVQIDQQASKVLDTDDTEPVEAVQDADRFLQTQVDILNSRALRIRVANALGLIGNTKFVDQMQYKLVDTPEGLLTLADARREQVLRILDENLSVDLPRNSRIVQISFKSPDPALAARIVNSFASNFILSNLSRKFDTSLYARNFLSGQLADAKARLEQSERATVEYARSAGLIDASAGIGQTGDEASSGPRSLVTSDLVQLNASYGTARTNRIALQDRWEQAQRTPLMSLSEVISNPAVMVLEQTRAQAQAAYDEERQHHKPDFPTMQQAQAQIQALDDQITKLATAIRNSLRDQYLTASNQEKSLSSSVSQMKGATLSEQDRSIRYNILKRETDTNRTMYDGLLQRYKEVSAAAGLTANNISPIDTADVPYKQISPRPLINLATASVLGLVLAIMLVLLRENFDDAIRAPDDISRKLGATFLASVPLLRSGETPHGAMQDPRSPLSEAYAALRLSLELIDPAGLPRSMLITSSRQSEGKSTSAYAIARNFAKLGRNVLLIDADLRKPSLHRLLVADNRVGFSNLLARHKTLEEVVQETDTPNLSFIPTGPLPPNPAELLSGAMLPALLRQLDEEYDLLVMDGPPVLGLADAILLATNTGGTVFVIEANGSHHGHAKAAMRRLITSGAQVLGAVLTKYDARKVGYGEEYGYSYYAYSYGQEKGAKDAA